DRLEKLNHAEVRVNAGERDRTSTGRTATISDNARGEAVASVVGNGGTSADGAINTGGTERAAEARVGGVDGRRGARNVEEAGVAVVVFVHRQQRVEANVAEVVDRENRAGMQFVLNADVHLIGTGRLEVR